jgi:hypothetical protein
MTVHSIDPRDRNAVIVLAAVKGEALARRLDGGPSDRCPRAGSRRPIRATAVRNLAGTQEWSEL